MKRKIVLALVAISLLIGGLSGIVYATDGHEPLRGEKLLGTGWLGTNPEGKIWVTRFRITNPDSLEDITIKRVSILDRQGTPIYDGPLVLPAGAGHPVGNRRIVGTIKSHQIMSLPLSSYIWTGTEDNDVTKAGNWLTNDEAMERNIGAYTMEIAWEAKGSVAPLVGWQRIIVRVTNEGGEVPLLRGTTETQMVNLKQK